MGKMLFYIAVMLSLFVSRLNAQSKIEKSFYEGQHNEVVRLVETKGERGKASIEELVFAARSSEQLFDFRKSIGFWQGVLALDPTDRQAIEGIADGYSNLGILTEAISHYQMIVPADTIDAAFWGKYASALSGIDQNAPAAKIYERLFAEHPTNIFFLKKWATAILGTKNFPMAITLLSQYIEQNPDDSSAIMLLATCYQRMEKDREAVQTMAFILDNDSTHFAALTKSAYIYFNNLRDYQSALNLYRRLNASVKEVDPVWLSNQAICEYFEGDIEFAARVLDSLSYVLASNVFVNFYAGLSYRKMGEIDKGLTFVEAASKMAVPAFLSDIYHHLGRIYSLKRMYKEAIGDYEKSREINKQNYLVLYDLALVYDETKMNAAAALGYYRQFLQECPVTNSVEAEYAGNRLRILKEDIFLQGN
jgi:tetratricopeptide (TPR) repeat protein